MIAQFSVESTALRLTVAAPAMLTPRTSSAIAAKRSARTCRDVEVPDTRPLDVLIITRFLSSKFLTWRGVPAPGTEVSRKYFFRATVYLCDASGARTTRQDRASCPPHPDVPGHVTGVRSAPLWWQAPAAKWLESVPVGNGRLGATVFGRVYKET